MSKKILSMVLVLCMMLSLSVGVFAASFPDVDEDHWAQAAIDRWSDYGVVRGTGDGFQPDENMTRAQAATVFTNLLKLESTKGAMSFGDVSSDDWFSTAVAKVTAAKIMNGVGKGDDGEDYMNPNANITREQFFVMFARALGIAPQDSTSGVSAEDASEWAQGYINALTDKGFVKGTGDGVQPLNNITRAQVMALLDQTITNYIDTNGSSFEGDGSKGVTLIVADDVTVTGEIDTLIIGGADNDEAGFDDHAGKKGVNLVGATLR